MKERKTDSEYDFPCLRLEKDIKVLQICIASEIFNNIPYLKSLLIEFPKEPSISWTQAHPVKRTFFYIGNLPKKYRIRIQYTKSSHKVSNWRLYDRSIYLKPQDIMDIY